MKIKCMISFLFALIVTFAGAQSDTIQHVVPDRANATAQQVKPYVILISIDGFRSDFAEKYNAANLLRLRQQGASATWMIPSYPSLTFPNHYSIVTGMYPAHHGLVDNSFYDPGRRAKYNKSNPKIAVDGSWYGGVPLWVLAEQQKMMSASFYWVGSEADISGVRPSYYYDYNEKIPMNRRLRVVRNWLALPAAKRPHFITFYFPEVDHEGHDHGPDSPEVAGAVRFVDESIGKMARIADSLHLRVNFVVVSDHGMTTIDTEHPIAVPAILRDTATCTISAGSTQIHVYVKDKNKIANLVQQLKSEATDYDVYQATEIPKAWHYGKGEDRFGRVGDILIVTRLPRVFTLNGKPPKPGNHGFDNTIADMRATFIAWGPDIKKATLAPFANVNVYPLVAHILGLTYSQPIDGNPKILQPALNTKK